MELTDGFSEFADDVQGDVRSSTSSSRDHRSCRYSTPSKRPSSSYTPYSNLYSREITSWKESHTCLPTTIVFRGLKNSPAKPSMTTATNPFEEPTVYGTLFEQADPWDTIGQILGLPNTKPSKSPGEVISELWSEASFETSSAVVGTEGQEDPMSPDDIPELQYAPLIERQLIGNRVSSDSDRQEEQEAENAGTALNQSPHAQLSCEDVAQVSEAATGDIEDEQLFIGKAYGSVLAIPELQEMDGLFIGPSLFELEDEI